MKRPLLTFHNGLILNAEFYDYSIEDLNQRPFEDWFRYKSYLEVNSRFQNRLERTELVLSCVEPHT